MLRCADFSEHFTIGRLTFSLQHITAAAGWIGFSFYLRHLIFDPCIKLLPLLPQLHARCRNHAKASPFTVTGFHHLIYKDLRFPASIPCHHTGIAVDKKRFSLLKFCQCNRQRCHQFFCGKSCHNTADPFFCQCFTQMCSRNRIHMSRI